MKKAKMTIQGMHCASCVANVERSLKKVPGVEGASVSLMLKKGVVELDEKAGVSEGKLRKAVERAGYEAKGIEFE